MVTAEHVSAACSPGSEDAVLPAKCHNFVVRAELDAAAVSQAYNQVMRLITRTSYCASI
jgi:hypothetical protein